MHRNYSRSNLVGYIVKSLESGSDISVLANQVAAFLIDIGRLNELTSIMRDAQEKRALNYGIVELTARSAHKLSAEQKKQIEHLAAKQYKIAKKVTLHQVEDQSVVGGVSLNFPHSSLDLTIRAKLNQLREAVS